MIIALFFFLLGVGLTIYPLINLILRSIGGKPTFYPKTSEDGEAKKQSANMKKAADILERDRMDRMTDPNYFKK